ncbi:hypothetical protein HN51_029567 [Arachis hypogaea]
MDAWSNTTIDREINDANNKNFVSSIGKLSLSSLDLSMESGYMDEEPKENKTSSDNKSGFSNWLTPLPWIASIRIRRL